MIELRFHIPPSHGKRGAWLPGLWIRPEKRSKALEGNCAIVANQIGLSAASQKVCIELASLGA